MSLKCCCLTYTLHVFFLVLGYCYLVLKSQIIDSEDTVFTAKHNYLYVENFIKSMLLLYMTFNVMSSIWITFLEACTLLLNKCHVVSSMIIIYICIYILEGAGWKLLRQICFQNIIIRYRVLVIWLFFLSHGVACSECNIIIMKFFILHTKACKITWCYIM